MKKMVFLLMATFGLMSIVSCETKKQKENVVEITTSDSLQQILNQKESELNDMVSTMGEIQDGFRKINEAQGRIAEERKNGETSRKEVILKNLKDIQENIQLNNELIANLRQQLKESKSSNSQLRKTMEASIASLNEQLNEMTKQMNTLREELAQKDIKIAEQGEEINNLRGNVNQLAEQNETRAKTVASQDQELHTAYYVFGTKSELKEQNILAGGEVLRKSNFNKDYFTKIDIRVDKVIKLYSKSARLMTTHPADSYSLDADAKGQYTLRITDPNRFWSVSKYLVITVK
ncbi:MAG: hypothetical protein HUK09_05040 [Bacteroidaceae bacterium]|nr:hypothetical protein [Bacteroidaceae bacterium]